MQILIVLAAVAAAEIHAALPGSESRLVRAVTDGNTIDVETIGRVRLLGITAPKMGRGLDAGPPSAREARDKLASLVLRHWVRLEREEPEIDTFSRKPAYVVRDDGLFGNAVLVREGLARVSTRAISSRAGELRRVEREARSFRRGLWGYTAKKCPRSPSNTPRSARSASATSCTTGSITGRSGFSSSSSRPGR